MGRKRKQEVQSDQNTQAPEHLSEALSRGLVVSEPSKLVVPAAYSPTKVDLSQRYDRYLVADKLSPEEFGRAVSALCQGDMSRAAELFNRQYDIVVRTPIRRRLVSAAKKPDRAILSAAKELVAAGLA